MDFSKYMKYFIIHKNSRDVLMLTFPNTFYYECNKWRLLFSKRKLSAKQRQQLEEIIADVSYSCGATTEDLILPEALASVCIVKVTVFTTSVMIAHLKREYINEQVKISVGGIILSIMHISLYHFL